VVEIGFKCFNFWRRVGLQVDPTDGLPYQVSSIPGLVQYCLICRESPNLKAAVENDENKKLNFESETVVPSPLQAGPSKF